MERWTFWFWGHLSFLILGSGSVVYRRQHVHVGVIVHDGALSHYCCAHHFYITVAPPSGVGESKNCTLDQHRVDGVSLYLAQHRDDFVRNFAWVNLQVTQALEFRSLHLHYGVKHCNDP